MSAARAQIGAHSPKITARRQRNRQVLIDVAAKAFAEKGVNAISVDQVIDDAGIAKSTFYTFFRSKDELVSSILAPVFVSGTVGLEAIDETEPEAIIDEIIEIYLYLWREYRHAVYLITTIDEKYFILIETEHEAYRHALEDVVQRIAENANFTDSDARHIYQLIARCAVPVLKVFGDSQDAESRFKTAMKGLLNPSSTN